MIRMIDFAPVLFTAVWNRKETYKCWCVPLPVIVNHNDSVKINKLFLQITPRQLQNISHTILKLQKCSLPRNSKSKRVIKKETTFVDTNNVSSKSAQTFKWWDTSIISTLYTMRRWEKTKYWSLTFEDLFYIDDVLTLTISTTKCGKLH